MRKITVKDQEIISDGLLHLAYTGQINLVKLLTDAEYFKTCVDLYVEAWNTTSDIIRN